MRIDELLKNPESLSKTYRTLLHDVDFELDGTVLSAVCRNHFEAELISVVAGKLICEGVHRERGIMIPGIAVTPSANDLVPSDMEASKFVTGPGAKHPEYVLSSFLVEETNAVAFSAVVDLVDSGMNPEQEARLLYVYGDEGCGKTHLLHAVVNGLAESGKRLAIFDGPQFAQYLLEAASLTGVAREIHSMQLHEADGLAVDDIGPIAGNDKQKVQQEFASVLDDLGQEGKYGIFTGRYSPTDWHWKPSPDLSNRLMKGRPAAIEGPSPRLFHLPGLWSAFRLWPWLQGVFTVSLLAVMVLSGHGDRTHTDSWGMAQGSTVACQSVWGIIPTGTPWRQG